MAFPIALRSQSTAKMEGHPVRRFLRRRSCLFAKRLEHGRFRWLEIKDGVVRLTAAQLSALLEGLDRVRVHGAWESRAPLAAS